jgi:hypothetical protein
MNKCVLIVLCVCVRGIGDRLARVTVLQSALHMQTGTKDIVM